MERPLPIADRTSELMRSTCVALRAIDHADKPGYTELTMSVGDAICEALGVRHILSVTEVMEESSNRNGNLGSGYDGLLALLTAVGLSKEDTDFRAGLYKTWIYASTGRGGIAPIKLATHLIALSTLDDIRTPDRPQVSELMRTVSPTMKLAKRKLRTPQSRHLPKLYW